MKLRQGHFPPPGGQPVPPQLSEVHSLSGSQTPPLPPPSFSLSSSQKVIFNESAFCARHTIQYFINVTYFYPFIKPVEKVLS